MESRKLIKEINIIYADKGLKIRKPIFGDVKITCGPIEMKVLQKKHVIILTPYFNSKYEEEDSIRAKWLDMTEKLHTLFSVYKNNKYLHSVFGNIRNIHMITKNLDFLSIDPFIELLAKERILTNNIDNQDHSYIRLLYDEEYYDKEFGIVFSDDVIDMANYEIDNEFALMSDDDQEYTIDELDKNVEQLSNCIHEKKKLLKKNKYTKYAALILYAQGFKPFRIIETLSISQPTFNSWINEYLDDNYYTIFYGLILCRKMSNIKNNKSLFERQIKKITDN